MGFGFGSGLFFSVGCREYMMSRFVIADPRVVFEVVLSQPLDWILLLVKLMS